MLYKFAALGRAIPVKGWESSLLYGERIRVLCEDYETYLKIAYLLPPSWYLVDRLKPKSWLHLLRDAGVLAGDVLQTVRGYKCIAKDGHACNSLAELEIDNWFFLNGIEHEREPYYPLHEKYNPNTRLRADFKVQNTYIEYGGSS